MPIHTACVISEELSGINKTALEQCQWTVDISNRPVFPQQLHHYQTAIKPIRSLNLMQNIRCQAYTRRAGNRAQFENEQPLIFPCMAVPGICPVARQQTAMRALCIEVPGVTTQQLIYLMKSNLSDS